MANYKCHGCNMKYTIHEKYSDTQIPACPECQSNEVSPQSIIDKILKFTRDIFLPRSNCCG